MTKADLIITIAVIICSLVLGLWLAIFLIRKTEKTVLRGLLVRETQITENGKKLFERGVSDFLNWEKTYQYDEKKNKTKEVQVFLFKPAKVIRIIDWSYNEKGLVVIETVDDKDRPANSRRTKYDYDNKGRKVKELRWSDKTQQWRVSKPISMTATGT